jgi:hypothetical protein
MFERYTEKARRAIFFARYEASQFGSQFIETEHLLLGVLREHEELKNLLPAGTNSIRVQLETQTKARKSISTTVDLPLSNPSKRVLAYAADEAERLNHRHIGCQHLLLGLLREKDGFAAKLLQSFSISIEQLRTIFAEQPEPPRMDLPVRRHGAAASQIVRIHGAIWSLKRMQVAVQRCREFNWQWHKLPWKARDLVIDRKSGKMSFDLGLAADAENFELLKGGWKKDHCAVCRWALFESEDAEHGVGYTNGRDWVCTECYDKFWDRPDFISGSYSEIT